MEPKNVYEALTDSDWIVAMQDELHQFERKQVWHLVPKPKDRTIIGTKWVFRNKLVVRNSHQKQDSTGCSRVQSGRRH